MPRNRVYNLSALLLVTAGLAFGVAACGDDSRDTDDRGSTSEVTPKSNAPDSAGDKSKNAPDDVISEKPGGYGTPVSP